MPRRRKIEAQSEKSDLPTTIATTAEPSSMPVPSPRPAVAPDKRPSQYYLDTVAKMKEKKTGADVSAKKADDSANTVYVMAAAWGIYRMFISNNDPGAQETVEKYVTYGVILLFAISIILQCLDRRMRGGRDSTHAEKTYLRLLAELKRLGIITNEFETRHDQLVDPLVENLPDEPVHFTNSAKAAEYVFDSASIGNWLRQHKASVVRHPYTQEDITQRKFARCETRQQEVQSLLKDMQNAVRRGPTP
jgi:hypothetical protein